VLLLALTGYLVKQVGVPIVVEWRTLEEENARKDAEKAREREAYRHVTIGEQPVPRAAASGPLGRVPAAAQAPALRGRPLPKTGTERGCLPRAAPRAARLRLRARGQASSSRGLCQKPAAGGESPRHEPKEVVMEGPTSEPQPQPKGGSLSPGLMQKIKYMHAVTSATAREPMDG
jgi:hypothetical protein